MKRIVIFISIMFLLEFICFGMELQYVKVQKSGTSNWKEYKTMTLTGLGDLNRFKEKPLTEFGGNKNFMLNKTGYYHVIKKDETWHMVDPMGCKVIIMGVNSVSPNEKLKDHSEAFKTKFGNVKKWTKLTKDELLSMKYNSLACWSDWRSFKKYDQNMPYMRRWNVASKFGKSLKLTYAKYGHTGFKGDVIPVFEDGFEEFCDRLFKEAEETADDPWLIGHFTDNELPIKSKDLLKRCLDMDITSGTYKKAKSWLKAQGIDEKNITIQNDITFNRILMEKYYSTVNKYLKKYDPNHLNLGTRLHGSVSKQEETYEVSGKYADVISINYYHRWTPDQDKLNKWSELAKRPILITEWYAKGEDSGLDIKKGAGFLVKTQKDRAMFYENYTMGLLMNKNVIGWNWFRYIDDGPFKTKGNSSNKGYLAIDFSPYSELMKSMKAINRISYDLQKYLQKNEVHDFQVNTTEKEDND